MQQTIAFYEAIEASPKPAVVVMQEMGSRREFASHSGEVMTTLMKNFGAVGLVTDGSVRDFNEDARSIFTTSPVGPWQATPIAALRGSDARYRFMG